MIWTNMVLGLVIPNIVSTSNSGSELISILTLSCCMEAFGDKLGNGVVQVRGYTHWKISGILR